MRDLVSPSVEEWASFRVLEQPQSELAKVGVHRRAVAGIGCIEGGTDIRQHERVVVGPLRIVYRVSEISSCLANERTDHHHR